MSLSENCANISREQILREYGKAPESAPLKIPALVSTAAAEDYRFEKLMARFTGLTAGALVDEAARDAEMVKRGSGLLLAKGIVTVVAGMASLACMAAVPVLFLVGLPCLYFGMTWIRAGNDKLRQSRYDAKFAADVIRYAGHVSDAGG